MSNTDASPPTGTTTTTTTISISTSPTHSFAAPLAHTFSSLPRMSPQSLASRLQADPPGPASRLAVVDVRDSDYIGGHIRGSVHEASGNFDWKLPELARVLAAKEMVVFHCMLSQQRGPGMALRYIRYVRENEEREKEREREQRDDTGEVGVGVPNDQGERKRQQVFLLQGGFMKWQEKYGNDERLTEGFVKDLWESGAYD